MYDCTKLEGSCSPTDDFTRAINVFSLYVLNVMKSKAVYCKK